MDNEFRELGTFRFSGISWRLNKEEGVYFVTNGEESISVESLMATTYGDEGWPNGLKQSEAEYLIELYEGVTKSNLDDGPIFVE